MLPLAKPHATTCKQVFGACDCYAKPFLVLRLGICHGNSMLDGFTHMHETGLVVCFNVTESTHSGLTVQHQKR